MAASERRRVQDECLGHWRASGAAEETLFARASLRADDPRLPAAYRRLAGLLSTMLEPSGPWLVALSGARGCGKTYLGCALVRECCLRNRSAVYRRLQRHFDELTCADWERKEAVRRKLLRPHVLVLDEVQVRDTDRQKQDNELTLLIDERYARRRPTLLLSNLTPEALVKSVGESIHRRLNEAGGIYEAKWPRIQEILGGA